MRASLYLHFPFCLKKCLYCDFNSAAASDLPPAEYAGLLLREMELRAERIDEPVTAPTLYLGGGTPSLMAPEDVGRIIDAAARLFHLESGAEITLEANPGTLTRDRVAGFRLAGVNRLSLGVQALEDRLLARLGRVHTVQDAREAVLAARQGGFDNLSIDLMHSLPEQTLAQWEAALEQALVLAPEHISAYALTVESGTPFALLQQKGELPLPEEEEGAQMFEATERLARKAGFSQYEISNFARPGFESRHNGAYWSRASYLGFGAGAHSFWNPDGLGTRWHNDPSAKEYARAIGRGVIPVRDRQRLTLEEAVSESFFLGLRVLEGLDLARLTELYGTQALSAPLEEVKQLIRAGLLVAEQSRIRLAPRAVILANTVFSRFL